ncbi:MAG TPA: hypothetical protein VIS77_06195, partial [Burkholderiales bacterium]
MGSMDAVLNQVRQFSPWISAPGATCRSCTHAIGWRDGLLCQRTSLAPNGYACHAWARAPGADDA